jgi:ATP-binding cassette, subfamily F, member 3
MLPRAAVCKLCGPVTLLVLNDVHKHWPGRDLLEGASLQIDPGEKLGLVGPNGAGKTTLLKLIIGEDSPDGGSVALRRGARLGYVPQRPEFARGLTVRGVVAAGLSELLAALAEHHRISEALSHGTHEDRGEHALDDAALHRLIEEQDRLGHLIETLGGWHVENRVEQVLAGVGLAPGLWDREAATLSGGEKSRTALAAALVGGHDLLILDEPTNHLDLHGIEWIEEYLRTLPGSVLIVSHDRRLLDTAVDAIVELEHGKLSRYPGGYSKYLRLRAERYLSERRAYDEQQEYIRKEEAFIRKYMGGQRTAEARGRRTRLASLKRLPEPRHDVRAPVIRLPPAAEGGELVLEARELSGGYPARPGAAPRALFAGVDLRVDKGQRIGIVGRNGAGKTTLLKILAGRMEPLSGELRTGHKAACGYYDQETAGLLASGTPMTEIRRDHPLMVDGDVRSWLARFLFRGDDVEKDVTMLSGGERARLSLAKLVLNAPTWLALDEPTNHLDLPGRTALEEALSEFTGAMLFVSHDRAFLDGLCTHIMEVGNEDDPVDPGDPGEDAAGAAGAAGGAPGRAARAPPRRVRLLFGNYSEWHARVLRERGARQVQRKEDGPRPAAAQASQASQAPAEAKSPAAGSRSSQRKPASAKGAAPESGAAPSKSSSSGAKPAAPGSGPERVRNPFRFKQLEQRIMELEQELKVLHAKIASPEVYLAPEKLKATGQRLAVVEQELAAANTEWENWG